MILALVSNSIEVSAVKSAFVILVRLNALCLYTD